MRTPRLAGRFFISLDPLTMEHAVGTCLLVYLLPATYSRSPQVVRSGIAIPEGLIILVL